MSCRDLLGLIVFPAWPNSPRSQLPWLENVPSVMDITAVAFADDVRVLHLVEIVVHSTSAREAERFLDPPVKETHHLSSEFAVESYPKNMEKAELWLRLQGKASRLVRDLHDDPLVLRIVLEATHLGPYCHHRHLAHPLKKARWLVPSCAAEAVLCSASDWVKFDKVIALDYEEQLNRQATKKTRLSPLTLPQPCGTTVYRVWTNEKVRKHWRLPKASTHDSNGFRNSHNDRRPAEHSLRSLGMFLFENTRASSDGRTIRPIGPCA